MYADIQPNADAFARALEELGEKIEQDVFEKVIVKAICDVWLEIMEENPTETCRCRNSWLLDKDFSEWALPEGDYKNVDFRAAVSAVMANLPISDHYVLFNNIEYVQALEEGHSTQAPAGFVAKALAAMTEFLSQAAKSVGYEVTA